jgi:hypothetical protein
MEVLDSPGALPPAPIDYERQVAEQGARIEGLTRRDELAARQLAQLGAKLNLAQTQAGLEQQCLQRTAAEVRWQEGPPQARPAVNNLPPTLRLGGWRLLTRPAPAGST